MNYRLLFKHLYAVLTFSDRVCRCRLPCFSVLLNLLVSTSPFWFRPVWPGAFSATFGSLMGLESCSLRLGHPFGNSLQMADGSLKDHVSCTTPGIDIRGGFDGCVGSLLFYYLRSSKLDSTLYLTYQYRFLFPSLLGGILPNIDCQPGRPGLQVGL